ncbi:EAL domain-containing protein [Spongiibacter tropicus]|uniref:EAL domain-containing protein n=1 Tax=Spongiibacter tropicus TaxID=454602 RepID=UPI0003B5EF91|nr:EAL domain-containing protein [Spongiibacter tropicus]
MSLIKIDPVDGIQRGEFYTIFEPQIHLSTGEVTGFEALARWHSPEYGNISPARFIPMLEESGQTYLLTRLVLAQTLDARDQLYQHGFTGQLSINISPQDLEDSHFARDVAIALEKSACLSLGLTFEVTESASIDDMVPKANLTELFRMGIKLSIDDFWTGFSTLDRAKLNVFSEVKIDHSIVSHALDDRVSLAGVSSIIHLAHNLGWDCVVEGIESLHMQNMMVNLGAQRAQGYLYSRGIDRSQLLDWYQSNRFLGAAPHDAMPSFKSDYFTHDERLFLAQKHNPVWVWDFDDRTISWANNAALAFWEVSSLTELQARDFEDMSNDVRIRLQSMRLRFDSGEREVNTSWTFYPNGNPKHAFCVMSYRKDRGSQHDLLINECFEGFTQLKSQDRFIDPSINIPVPFLKATTHGDIIQLNRHAHLLLAENDIGSLADLLQRGLVLPDEDSAPATCYGQIKLIYQGQEKSFAVACDLTRIASINGRGYAVVFTPINNETGDGRG